MVYYFIKFSNIKINGENVNGKLTLGENIADLGGVKISFDALKNYMKTHKLETLEGFTPEQRFFIAYARIWRCNIRDKELSNRLITDPHSPPETRIKMPLANFESWYEHFGVKPFDSSFIPENNRAQIW